MKRTILAILVSVLLVLAIPATAFAGTHTPVKCPPTHNTITATIGLYATARDVNEYPFGKYEFMTGTVYYQGMFADSNVTQLIGAPILAQESVYYLINRLTGDIIFGRVMGNLQLQTLYGEVATMSFQASVFGNIYTGPAFDVGSWKVTSASGSLAALARARGPWTAQAVFDPSLGTFVGYANISGSY